VKRWRSETGAAAGPVILALAALDAAGYSVIAPALPAISDATGAGPALIGALVATFPAGALVGFALAGPGVRQGRTREVLACGLLVVAVGCLGFIASDDLAVLFPARTLMGLGSGGLWMGVTFATLERAPGREYLGMSRLLAAYSAGSLIGPALGAIGGIRGPFAAYLALVLAGLLALPLLRPPRERRTFTSDWSALRLPGFWFACAAGLVAVIGLGIIEGVLPLHLDAELSQAQIGGLYAGLALLLAGTAVAAGYASPRAVIAAGTGLLVAGIALAGLTDTPTAWIASLAVAGIGFGLTETGSAGALFEAVETERIVTAMIVWSQIGIVGYLIGPLAGGAVAEGLSFAWIGIVPLAAAAGLAALVLVLRGRYAAAAGSTADSARNGTR
jgi:MFS family permease